MNISPVKLWLGLLLAFLAAYAGYSAWRIHRLTQDRAAAEQAQRVELTAAAALVNQPIAPFTLTERNGEPFDTTSLEGRVWVASFFFASCPGPCLKMNSAIAALAQEFGPRGATFVSITVDPENDTPERLKNYAAHYRADPRQWRFLTGEMETIKHVAVEEFRLPFATAAHSERLVLVGPDGIVRGQFAGTDPTQIALLKKKLTELLAQIDDQPPVPSESGETEAAETASPAEQEEASP